MSADGKTIGVYDARVEDYAGFFGADQPPASLQRFMSELPAESLPPVKVLDLGCGPAQSAKFMMQAGFDVDASDASSEMARIAKEKNGVDAVVATFDDLTTINTYDGIWANFSLLHAKRADFPRYLAQIKVALKSGGIFHIGMKLGNGEARDKLGRFYTYYSEEELLAYLSDCGFEKIAIHKGEEKGLSGSIDPFILVLSKAVA